MCFAPQRRALFRHLNFQKWSDAEVFCTFWLGNVLRATTACTFSTSQLPKVVREWCVLYILTWKCASRHNGVHFFDISTSKSGPTLRCFVHFDLEMCFAPQRRALFRHLNFQKWSDAEVFCTFWLGNVLRATTACTFSTSQLPKVVRRWGVFYILTWKCASRHKGVHFFDISTSNIGPTLEDVWEILTWKCAIAHSTAFNFSSLQWPAGSAPAGLASLLFDPPVPQIIGNSQSFATFLPCRSICILRKLTLNILIISLLSLPLIWNLPCSAFHLSRLSEVWLLNFLRIDSIYIILSYFFINVVIHIDRML